MTALELLICGALIGCSAFLSASEVAIFSLSRIQLRGLKDRFDSAHRKIKKLQSDAGGVLITILVLNEVVNVSLSTILAGILDRYFRNQELTWLVKTLLGVLITTPVLLLFCEVTPKTVAARANTLIAPLVASPISVLYNLMKPLRLAIRRMIQLISGAKHQSPLEKGHPIQEEEFMVMVEEGHREGAIQRSELDLIQNVFRMDDTPVRELMTPLTKVDTIHETMSISEAVDRVRLIKSARIPVLSKDRKDVLGILYLKDLLRARLNPALGNSPLAQLMHKPLVVSQQTPVNRVFKRLRQSQTHIAVVSGPNDEPIGVITLDRILDDLLEELIQEKKR
ncbi:DUF21 domain-containing protein [bacterium]|nr:DUF21 domain-containing protein [bacterium]